MAREQATVEVMIREFCRLRHGKDSEICPECLELLKYAEKRLSLCPFQEGKTTCGNCAVHCYKPAMRARIREVMRTIGPRMMFAHPIMGIMHLIDGLRKKPKSKP